MNTISFILTFAAVWWVVIFVILPFKVKVPEIHGSGHADSAPLNPMIGRKILITTLISLLITWSIRFLIEKGYLSHLVM